MTSVRRGFFEVQNPFNRRISRVPGNPDRVAAIVFWSKNFGPFLSGGYGRALHQGGHRLFFNLTVNTPNSALEPNLPPLNKRLEQMTRLTREVMPEAVNWRFDPICCISDGGDSAFDSLDDFTRIADHAGRLGIRRCITSFVDLYPKVRKRTTAAGGPGFVEPPLAAKIDRLLAMESVLSARGIALLLCCEKELLERLPSGSGITAGACVSGHLLERLYGPGFPLKRDRGQRVTGGCGCTVSSDVGSYGLHPCGHNCLYCYANPSGSDNGIRSRTGCQAP